MDDAPTPRDALARWAERTQTLLDELVRLLDAHDALSAQVPGLETRAREADKRADEAEQRLAEARRQLDEMRFESSRLEALVTQLQAERHAAPAPSVRTVPEIPPRPQPAPVAPTAATGPRRPPVIRFSAVNPKDAEPGAS